MGGACSTYKDRRGAYRVLVRKLEGNSPLIRRNHEGSIILKWIFKKWNGSMDWIYLA
jgi:hypothetical protein